MTGEITAAKLNRVFTARNAFGACPICRATQWGLLNSGEVYGMMVLKDGRWRTP